MAEVNNMLDHTVKKVNQENYGKIKQDDKEYNVQTLKHELFVLKEIQKNEGRMKDKFEAEREALKEEKNELEYMLFDMFKANNLNKERLNRIKEICDEGNQQWDCNRVDVILL